MGRITQILLTFTRPGGHEGKEGKMKEDIRVYIDSLEQAGEKLTEQEWRDWIVKENKEYMAQDERVKALDEEDIELIIKTLTEEGYIREEA